MLHNSISVDMKVYTLQLKQKYPLWVFPMKFCKILEQLATFENVFLGAAASEKKTKRRRCTVSLVVSGFHFFQGHHLLSHKAMFSLHKFLHSRAFQFFI